MTTITSRDVARVAGVTQPTVSRALSGRPGVSEATREHIRSVAQTLGYVPIDTGRSLVTRRTGRIGIVAAELDNPYFTSMVTPLHDVLGAAGYRPLLIVDRQEKSVELASLVDGSLDGVILTTSHRRSSVPQELTRRRIPFVLLGREVDGVTADACVVDNTRGAALAAEFLVDLGHRRIGALFGPRWTSTGYHRERVFRRRLKTRKISLESEHVSSGAFEYATGHDGLLQLMSTKRPPTAVFCANDVIAIGALNAADHLQIQVPDQLTVLGFDDIPLASWDVFQLTTIHTDLEALAAEACGLLLDRLKSPDAPPRRVVVPVELALRATHREKAP